MGNLFGSPKPPKPTAPPDPSIAAAAETKKLENAQQARIRGIRMANQSQNQFMRPSIGLRL